MYLVVGATGALGGRVANRLARRDLPVRALVRPDHDAAALRAAGVEVAHGDLMKPETLPAALAGVDSVLTTANAIGRLLAGDRSTSIAGVDRDGNAALVTAAERAGVTRFLFVSIPGLDDAALVRAPFPAAKLATEQRLAASAMRTVVVQPDAFQEVWLEPQTGLDPARGRALVYGHGRSMRTYVSTDDAAEACVRLALHDDPPAVVTFGGPDRLTRMQVVELVETGLGRSLRRRHVPRSALVAGSRLLRSVKPELASVMALALYFDRHDATCTAEPLRELGITPRTAADYLGDVVARASGARTSA
jgi:uncharacterized protein YbjT (DUF2867 family)